VRTRFFEEELRDRDVEIDFQNERAETSMDWLFKKRHAFYFCCLLAFVLRAWGCYTHPCYFSVFCYFIGLFPTFYFFNHILGTAPPQQRFTNMVAGSTSNVLVAFFTGWGDHEFHSVVMALCCTMYGSMTSTREYLWIAVLHLIVRFTNVVYDLAIAAQSDTLQDVWQLKITMIACLVIESFAGTVIVVNSHRWCRTRYYIKRIKDRKGADRVPRSGRLARRNKI